MLVLADATEVAISNGSLFSLINDATVFICETYLRDQCMEAKTPGHPRKTSLYYQRKWWAKAVSLKRIFKSFVKLDQALYMDVLITQHLSRSGQLKTAVHVKARGSLEAVMRCDTVLTAQLILQSFEWSLLSKYIQSS